MVKLNPALRDEPVVTGKLLLIDGQGICYRAFYAIRELSNSRGEPTNAIYGFITIIRKLLKELKPSHVAICFDRKEATFRHEMYKEYKAQRKPMPDELIEQIPHIKDFVSAYRFATFEKAGYEADDIIGTLATQADQTGLDVVIVTGDKDMQQLVNDRIKIFNTHKEKIVDEEGVRERFGGLGPTQVVDVLSLAGDASDNIPGVPGIGEKTAVSLVHDFNSLDGVYQHIDEIKGARQKKLKENEESARLSKNLATIDRQVPLDVSFEKMRLVDPDTEKLSELARRFEFRMLQNEFSVSDKAREGERHYHTVTTSKALKTLVKQLENTKFISVDTETTSVDALKARLIGMSFSLKPEEAYYVPISSLEHKGPGIAWEEVKKEIAPVLENKKIQKCGQNIKYDLIVLKRHGIMLRGISFDTMIASYIVNPIKLNHNLDDISFEYLGLKKVAFKDLIGVGKKQIPTDEVPLEKMAEYACEDADAVFRLVTILKEHLKRTESEKLFSELEMPLLEVLGKIEMNGVSLDKKLLKSLSEELGSDLETLETKIYQEAGETFNINSTKQLADILFTKLKLPIIKRTKTGYSTDAGVLDRLSQTYTLPKLLLDYREKTKLKSTYIDALPNLINSETKLVHTSFNQTVTSTGRLSSSEPNFQNIPIRTELGRNIRRAFIPREKGRKILSADYSQVELRILAHLSNDPALVKAFKNGEDIHQLTATSIYPVHPDQVTRQMRNIAKTINFSIVYGVSAFGLAQSLSISVSEAQTFIDAYFKRYAGVKTYLEAQKEKAHKDGFLTTVLGRRSYFPDINASNPMRRQFAERAAINAPIQGSAADMIKLAMIEIQKVLEEKQFASLMILQVHDELVFDMVAKEEKELTSLVRDKMEHVFALDVPLKVDMTAGTSWYKE